MKKAIIYILQSLLLGLGLANFNVSAASDSDIQRIAVPSYIYPSSQWQPLLDVAPTVGLTIINPMNGSINS